MFRSPPSDRDSDDPSPKASGPSQWAICALVAAASCAALVLSGVLSSSSDVDIEPVKANSTATEDAANSQADVVMLEYLFDVRKWTACENEQRPDATDATPAAACGAMPEQPNDPRLNAYLAEVLNWNKCAAPRLKQGAVEQAAVACGPPPESPLPD